MAEFARGPASPRLAALPRPLAPGLIVPAAACVDALARAGAAATPYDVASGVLDALTGLDGVRAGALVARAGPSTALTVIGSAGYDCGTFAPGATLPADAGLPVTEAARTQRAVVQGNGPSWVAVPVPDGGALLLSLTVPPPAGRHLRDLARLAAALGPVLRRAARAEAQRHESAVLVGQLAAEPPAETAAAPELAVVSRPYDGDLGGDVAELVGDDAGSWLLVADVSGRGATAAVAAVRLRAAFRAVAPICGAPSEVLRGLDRALSGGDEDFVTALVVRLQPGRVIAASAGHPAPLVVADGVTEEPELTSGRPLGLALGDLEVADAELRVPPGALLVTHTDGLVDRGAEVDLTAVLATLPPGTPAASAAEILRRCEQAGPASDDVTLVVLRP